MVDSASIAVNRRHRRAKTDRLDVNKLLTMWLRHVAGERKVSSVVRVPSIADEDRRQLQRYVNSHEFIPLFTCEPTYAPSPSREMRCSMPRDAPSGRPSGGTCAGTTPTSARLESAGHPFSWGAHAAFCFSRRVEGSGGESRVDEGAGEGLWQHTLDPLPAPGVVCAVCRVCPCAGGAHPAGG